LRIDAGKHPGTVVIAGPNGRIHARGDGSGFLEFSGLPCHPLLVSKPSAAAVLLLP
jgi:hypothetical protein